MKSNWLKFNVIAVTLLFIFTMVVATVIAYKRPSSSTKMDATTIYKLRQK